MVVPRYSHRPLEIKKCWMIKLEVGNIRESCFQRVNKLFFANLPTQNYIKCLGPPYTPKKSCTSNPHLMIWGCIFTSYLNLVPPFSGKPLDSRCVCLLDTSPPEVPPKIVVVEFEDRHLKQQLSAKTGNTTGRSASKDSWIWLPWLHSISHVSFTSSLS